MKTLQFKTNINCGACVSKVSPVLNSNPQITKWHVNTDAEEKLLQVETEELDADDIIHILKKIGYKAEEV